MSFEVKKVKLVLGLLILLAAPSTFAGEEIRVRHEAQVSQANVELGMIADIVNHDEANDGDVASALSQLILGESPKPGKSEVWTAEDLSKRLRPYSQLLKKAQVKLPERIVIRREKLSALNQDVLRPLVLDALKTTLPDPSWDVQILSIKAPLNDEIPKDGTVQVVPPLARPRGATNLEVLITNDGQLLQRQWITVQARFFSRVGITLRQIEAQTKLNPGDLKWERREVTYMMDVPVMETELGTAVAKATIPAGKILNRNDLAREMALHFGEDVEINVGSDDFVVTTKGVSQQNGFIGDIVKVRSPSNNKILTGEVVARGVVRVRY